MSTSFTPILQRTIDKVPNAIAAIFAAYDGEAVDQVGHKPKYDSLLIAAHYGIILNQVQSLLRLFHFGAAEEIMLCHERMDFVIRTVGDGYYLLLAIESPTHIATAQREVYIAAIALRREML
jgi:predicted regulator of Ras-like GTPase activity (Roadblock/LC7/MglB family)